MKIRKALAVALSIGLAIALFLVCQPVLAQNAKVEASAKALQKKAMDEDYLATEFAKAQEKLDKAVAACGNDKCSAPIRAQLHRDLGVVQIGGQIDKEKGIGNFVAAIKLDAATALDPDLRTKELDAAFAEAKKRAAGGGGGAPAGGGGGGAGGQPAGDFVHEPTAEQQIRTPIPVYVEYSGEEQLVKVIARYKGFGMTDWKTIELKKMGEKGWGAVLPCADVQQGTTLYYIQGFNAANDPVAVGGDRNNAYKVKVTRDKVADPPHLPNQPAPTQCADTGDCPPNFPGCKKAGPVVGPEQPSGKDGGEFCEEDSECKSKECKSSKCTDFEGGSEGKFRRVWVGLSVGFDYTLVPSADDVCKTNTPDPSGPAPLQPINSSNYYCVNSNGSDYPVRPVSDAERRTEAGSQNDRIVAGTSDKVSGGGAFGNVRIMAALDYALNMNVLLGARLGYVLNTYPGQAAKDDGKSFPPIHLELRGTYLIGKDAIMKKVAPFVMVGGGVSTFETAVKVSVVENAFPPATGKLAKDVDAWQLAGPAFVTFGGGARVGLSDRAAFMLGARVNLAFGNSFAPSFGPDIGIVFGF